MDWVQLMLCLYVLGCGVIHQGSGGQTITIPQKEMSFSFLQQTPTADSFSIREWPSYGDPYICLFAGRIYN